MPELENLKPVVAKRVFEEMRATGVQGSKQDLQKMHRDRTVKIVSFLSLSSLLAELFTPSCR